MMAEPRAVEQDRADAAHETVAAHGGRERCAGARPRRHVRAWGSARICGHLVDDPTASPVFCPTRLLCAPESPHGPASGKAKHWVASAAALPGSPAAVGPTSCQHRTLPRRESDDDAVAGAVFDQTRSDPGYEPTPANKPGTGWDARFATAPK